MTPELPRFLFARRNLFWIFGAYCSSSTVWCWNTKLRILVFITHSQLAVNDSCSSLLPSFSSVTFHVISPLLPTVYCALNQHLSTFPRASLSTAPSMPQSSSVALWQLEQWAVLMPFRFLCCCPRLPAGISVSEQTPELKNKTCLKCKPLFTQILFLCSFISLMLSYFYPSCR